MHVRYPNLMTRFFCRVGLSFLLVSTAARPLSAFAGEAGASENAGEPVPELLALADWPLDGVHAGTQRSGDNAVVDTDDLGPPTEIAGNEPIPTVQAGGYIVPVVRPAAADDSIRGRLGERRLALDDHALDEIRGGFEPPDSNLKFSFGIERAVYINGQLVASTVLNLGDLQWASGAGGTAGTMNVDAARLLVVQNGTGNNFQVQAGPNAFGTVVQNTLDNQKIQSVTTINAAVNSGQVLRAISIQSAIQDGLISSLRR